MGDMSKEPSMEEILSSIKRIIAEDHDEAARATPRRAPAERAATREQRRKAVVAGLAASDSGYADEVLELTEEAPVAEPEQVYADAVAEADDTPEPAPVRAAAKAPRPAENVTVRTKKPAPRPVAETAPTADADDEGEGEDEDMIVSAEIEEAARSSLAALSSMVVHSAETGPATTLEGLVREMLRPMLKQWLDANLPTMVEGMVAKEIARITGRSL